MNQKKLSLALLGLLAGAILLVLGVNFGLKLVTPTEVSPPPHDARGDQSNIKIQAPGGGDGTKVRILDQAPDDVRAITYREDGFHPSSVMIKATDAIGCLITVHNETSRPIRVGVNPHRPNGDPGANYGEIEPGEKELLDVRYPGLSEIKLHNHGRPEYEFMVTYGAGCGL